MLLHQKKKKKTLLLYYNRAYYTYNLNAVEDNIFTSVEHWIEFITDQL